MKGRRRNFAIFISSLINIAIFLITVFSEVKIKKFIITLSPKAKLNISELNMFIIGSYYVSYKGNLNKQEITTQHVSLRHILTVHDLVYTLLFRFDVTCRLQFTTEVSLLM